MLPQIIRGHRSENVRYTGKEKILCRIKKRKKMKKGGFAYPIVYACPMCSQGEVMTVLASSASFRRSQRESMTSEPRFREVEPKDRIISIKKEK